MGTLEERVPPESESVSVQERKIFSNFTRPHPSNTDFTRCVGNAQGPERMHECPEELRKSALFILNANGASLLLAASFGVQGLSKQKGAVEIGWRWKHGTRLLAFAAAGASGGPLNPRAVSQRVATSRLRVTRRPGGGTTRRGHSPEAAESGSGASVSAQSLSETLYLEAHFGGPRKGSHGPSSVQFSRSVVSDSPAYSAPFARTHSQL